MVEIDMPQTADIIMIIIIHGSESQITPATIRIEEVIVQTPRNIPPQTAGVEKRPVTDYDIAKTNLKSGNVGAIQSPVKARVSGNNQITIVIGFQIRISVGVPLVAGEVNIFRNIVTIVVIIILSVDSHCAKHQ